MAEPPNRRERRKLQTRETIERAAHELFVARGYRATTVPDIAEAADVSTRTVFGHFPNKEDILFSRYTPLGDALAGALANRPAGQDALDAIRAYMLAAYQMDTTELSQRLNRCVVEDPALRNQLRARIGQLEEVLRPAIAADLNVSEDDERPQLAAATLTAAFALLADRNASTSEPWTMEEAEAVLDPVFVFVRAGLDALG